MNNKIKMRSNKKHISLFKRILVERQTKCLVMYQTIQLIVDFIGLFIELRFGDSHIPERIIDIQNTFQVLLPDDYVRCDFRLPTTVDDRFVGNQIRANIAILEEEARINQNGAQIIGIITEIRDQLELFRPLVSYSSTDSSPEKSPDKEE